MSVNLLADKRDVNYSGEKIEDLSEFASGMDFILEYIHDEETPPRKQQDTITRGTDGRTQLP